MHHGSAMYFPNTSGLVSSDAAARHSRKLPHLIWQVSSGAARLFCLAAWPPDGPFIQHVAVLYKAPFLWLPVTFICS